MLISVIVCVFLFVSCERIVDIEFETEKNDSQIINQIGSSNENDQGEDDNDQGENGKTPPIVIPPEEEDQTPFVFDGVWQRQSDTFLVEKLNIVGEDFIFISNALGCGVLGFKGTIVFGYENNITLFFTHSSGGFVAGWRPFEETVNGIITRDNYSMTLTGLFGMHREDWSHWNGLWIKID